MSTKPTLSDPGPITGAEAIVRILLLKVLIDLWISRWSDYACL